MNRTGQDTERNRRTTGATTLQINPVQGRFPSTPASPTHHAITKAFGRCLESKIIRVGTDAMVATIAWGTGSTTKCTLQRQRAKSITAAGHNIMFGIAFSAIATNVVRSSKLAGETTNTKSHKMYVLGLGLTRYRRRIAHNERRHNTPVRQNAINHCVLCGHAGPRTTRASLEPGGYTRGEHVASGADALFNTTSYSTDD